MPESSNSDIIPTRISTLPDDLFKETELYFIRRKKEMKQQADGSKYQ